MSSDRIELVSYARYADNQITLSIRNAGARTLQPGMLRVVLSGLVGEQRLSPTCAWPVEPNAQAQIIAVYASMVSSDRGMHIAKVDVLDYLELDGTLVPCGAVVEFEGWRQVTRIRHQAH